MTEQPESSLTTWSTAENQVSIEYPVSLLQEIDAYVREAFHRLSRGGMEVGGVLFGVHEDSKISLHAWRPISCEYSKGPCFVLSENDKSDLEKFLEASAKDPKLNGMEPLGWFVSHTRTGVAMQQPDLEIYQQYFPEPWQVALLLHPVKSAATRAGFFIREANGSVPENARREFAIEGPQTAGRREVGTRSLERRPAERRLRLPEPAPGIRAMAPEVPERWSEEQGIEAQRFVAHGPARMHYWDRIAIILAVLTGVGVAAGYHFLPAVLHPFSFDALDTDGQLRIHWDNSAKAVREATRGVLEIRDGQKAMQFNLDAGQVRSGSFTYTRRSEDVEMRLTVYELSGTSLMQFSHFLGPPPTNPELISLREERDRLSAQVAKLQSDLAAERNKSAKLEQVNKLRENLLQLDNVLTRRPAASAPATPPK
ncbi:MAG TPA: hypothetical protein VKV15_23925 [Bryobacteraceae bacterium]|nr:hypothetical protein [Bryobacteraceae bacterium]